MKRMYLFIALVSISTITHIHTSESDESRTEQIKGSPTEIKKDLRKVERSLTEFRREFTTLQNSCSAFNHDADERLKELKESSDAAYNTIAEHKEDIENLTSNIKELRENLASVMQHIEKLAEAHQPPAPSKDDNDLPLHQQKTPDTVSAHEKSVDCLREVYVELTQAKARVAGLEKQIAALPDELEKSLGASNEQNKQMNQEYKEKSTALYEKIYGEYNEIRELLTPFRDAQPLESQLSELVKKHAIHMDSLGSTCALCFFTWKLLDKPITGFPRISEEQTEPVIHAVKEITLGSIFNAGLNHLRGTKKNGWKYMGIFAAEELIAYYIEKKINRSESHIIWLKNKTESYKDIVPYISWFIKASIAYWLA